MLDQALAETDTAKREAIWGQIDKRVMEERGDPAVRLRQGAQLGATTLTNVFVNEAYGQYDYLTMGAAK